MEVFPVVLISVGRGWCFNAMLDIVCKGCPPYSVVQTHCGPELNRSAKVWSYQPGCHERYRWDWYLFVDIDECSTGDHICNVRAHCNNTIGGYSCHCNDGYLGDGLTCDRRVYTVTGIVKDASTGKGIVRSIVSLGGRSTRTNSSGYFTFTNVPCLPYTLTAIGPGYVSNSKNVTVSEEGPDCVMANIVLSKELTSGNRLCEVWL